MSIILCALPVAIVIASCKGKSDLENQITIIINSVDKKTKQNRVNMFDSIDVRVAGFGILMRNYAKVAECITDSTGSVSVKLDKNKEYKFILHGKNIYGATGFYKGELKDGQEVNIEVISFENR
jgi:hypothetical protein